LRPIATTRNRIAPHHSRSIRTLQACLERLETRRLLSYADIELISLLPASGGDGSKGFVVDGIEDRARLGGANQGYDAVGDVNGDGVDDFIVSSLGTTVAPAAVGRAYLIFGRPGGFPASLDLNSLDGTSGYWIDGVEIGDGTGAYATGAGDLNHDGVPDLALGAHALDTAAGVDAGAVFVVYGGTHLAALDLADGAQDGIIGLADLDGAHGFRINGAVAGVHAGMVSSAGDVNGDHLDDLAIATTWVYGKPGKAYPGFLTLFFRGPIAR
jgi:hypothetical protein